MPVADNYSIIDYGVMIDDRRRTEPYVHALRAAVRPGDVVLDIGTGLGIFAFLACRYGAARVYAMEPDPVLKFARHCAAANEGSDRIQWLRGFSNEIDLPERVDVVIADLHGTMPTYNGNVESMIDARQRHLKPGGILIPGRDLMFVAPAQSAAEHRRTIAPWDRNEYEVRFEDAGRFVRNTWWRAANAAVSREDLLAAPLCWAELDYSKVESSMLKGEVEFSIERAGEMRGLYVWFDTETAPGIVLTNSPLLESIAYGRAYFPLESAIAVAPGDRVNVRLEERAVAGDRIFRWDTRVSSLATGACVEFRQSTFSSLPLDPDELRLGLSDHVPNLNEAGEIELSALQAMAQQLPLDQIAARLEAAWPKRFRQPGAALRHVSRLSLKYSS